LSQRTEILHGCKCLPHGAEVVMEDSRCTMAALQAEDPRCQCLLSGVAIEVEDPRHKILCYGVALEMDDHRCKPVTVEVEDPRCKNMLLAS